MIDIILALANYYVAKAKWRFVLIRPLAEANGNELLCQTGMNCLAEREWIDFPNGIENVS